MSLRIKKTQIQGKRVLEKSLPPPAEVIENLESWKKFLTSGPRRAAADSERIEQLNQWQLDIIQTGQIPPEIDDRYVTFFVRKTNSSGKWLIRTHRPMRPTPTKEALRLLTIGELSISDNTLYNLVYFGGIEDLHEMRIALELLREWGLHIWNIGPESLQEILTAYIKLEEEN